MEIISSPRLNEQYYQVKHPSGLTILLYPMEGFQSSYALFATQYGSVDTCFKTDQDSDFVEVPEGIAHFLEHKLFDNPTGPNADELFAAQGASANAYTSFDRTAYLFSCTQNFEQCIEILLDFVTKPYFTPESVQKEQGIIGQEIMMYQDDPNWRLFFNMLGGMYQTNPVRLDIAGTVESISHIDDQLLYRCYHSFYNLNNMVLSVAGNFSPEQVLATADRILPTAPPLTLQRQTPPEPTAVLNHLQTQFLPVSMPQFSLGFKVEPAAHSQQLQNSIYDDLLLDMIAGEATEFYRRLYDSGLINATFSTQSDQGRGFAFAMFSGESRDPQGVQEKICQEITRLQSQGLSQELFENYKKAAYGHYIGMYGTVNGAASLLLTTAFAQMDGYGPLEIIANVTLEEITERLMLLDTSQYTLSIISPSEESEYVNPA